MARRAGGPRHPIEPAQAMSDRRATPPAAQRSETGSLSEGAVILVEVCENFFGADIKGSLSTRVEQLSPEEVLELCGAIDRSLRAVSLTRSWARNAAVAMPYGAWSASWPAEGDPPERLCLLHDQVVVPLGSMERAVVPQRIPWSKARMDLDRQPLVGVIEWLTRTAPLHRSSALVVTSTRPYLTKAVSRVCEQAGRALDVRDIAEKVTEFAPVIEGLAVEEASDIIRSHLPPLFRKLLVARKMGGVPAATESYTHKLMRAITEDIMAIRIGGKELRESASFGASDVELPAIDRIAAEDIVSLKRNSEAFAEWRQRFGSYLRTVERAVEAGYTVEVAMRDAIEPVESAAEAIRKDLQGGSLRKVLGDEVRTFVLTASALYTADKILHALGAESSVLTAGTALLAKPLLAVLLWILFTRADEGQKQLLGFYSALIESVPE